MLSTVSLERQGLSGPRLQHVVYPRATVAEQGVYKKAPLAVRAVKTLQCSLVP